MSRATNLARAARGPLRAELATAIAARDEAEREAQSASDALQAAVERKREAEHRRDALLPREGEGAEGSGEAYGVAFAASLRAGRPIGADELDRQRRDQGAVLEMAEAELDVWQRTVVSCEALHTTALNALDWRQRAVERAARAVCCEPADVQKLATEVADAKALLLEKMAAFYFVLGCFEYSIEGVAARRKLENVLEFDPQPRSHPSYARGVAALEALKRDADAPLP